MNAIRAAACALLLGAATAAAGADRACTKADSAAAEKAIERVVNFAQLHKAWADYGHCDTGKVAEGFTDAVMRLIIGNWKTVEGLSGPWRDDAKYREFVTRRLQSKETEGDREDLMALAKSSCPRGQGAFCKEIVELLAALDAKPVQAPPPAAAAPAIPPASPTAAPAPPK